MSVRPLSYQILLTPLLSKRKYGEELDVTKDLVIDDFIKEGGISVINREVDNGDFDIGVFVFDSLALTCLNFDGKFSNETDSRSLFKYKRDKAKIKILFFDGKTNLPNYSFRGILDDRATRINFGRNEVKLKLLSSDSIINRVKIPGGLIKDNTLVSVAIKAILQLSDIIAVLDYNEKAVNLLNDYIIDDGAYFDNKNVKSALNELLAVSNSVMTIQKNTDKITVRSREYNRGDVHNLYGHGDLFGRENIIDIKRYNDGLQRAFNTINVGNISRSNLGLIDRFGDNAKTFSFSFIKKTETQAKIAADILDFWKTPKIELETEVLTSSIRALDFFDLVSIDYPYQVRPYKENKFPIYGSARYSEAVYPNIFGNLKIKPNVAFKIVGIKENPAKLTTLLKLRQIGKNIDDGFFSGAGNFYGSTRYGHSFYQIDENLKDPNIFSVYGAAKLGIVHYGNE